MPQKISERPKVVTDKTRRLRKVLKEWRNTQPEGAKYRTHALFAEILGVTRSTIIHQLNGTFPVSDTVEDALCDKLGYSREWVNLGTGTRKAGKKDTGHLTDIYTILNMLEIATKRIDILEARLNGQAKEIERLKHVMSTDNPLTKSHF